MLSNQNKIGQHAIIMRFAQATIASTPDNLNSFIHALTKYIIQLGDNAPTSSSRQLTESPKQLSSLRYNELHFSGVFSAPSAGSSVTMSIYPTLVTHTRTPIPNPACYE